MHSALSYLSGHKEVAQAPPPVESKCHDLVRQNVCSRLRHQLTHRRKSFHNHECSAPASDAQNTAFVSDQRGTISRQLTEEWEESSAWFLSPIHRQPRNRFSQPFQVPLGDEEVRLPNSKWDNLLAQHSSVVSLTSVDRRQLWEDVLKPRPTAASILRLEKAEEEKGKEPDCSGELLSPFTERIVKLRLQGLQLEEDFLLESKRQDALDFLEGPAPGWHELRTSRFHSEAHKNNLLLKSGLSPEQLCDCIAQLRTTCR